MKNVSSSRAHAVRIGIRVRGKAEQISRIELSDQEQIELTVDGRLLATVDRQGRVDCHGDHLPSPGKKTTAGKPTRKPGGDPGE